MNTKGSVVNRDLERNNKERLDLLHEKAQQIKEITITMNEHLEKESKNELSNMQSNFLTANPLVSRLIEKIGEISNNTHLGLYLMLFAFSIAFFALLYFLK